MANAINIILLAPLIAIITAAVATIIKTYLENSKSKYERAMPVITIGIAFLIGLAAYPFTSLSWDLRLWAGLFGGLVTAGVLDIELLKSTLPTKKGAK